MSFHKAFKGITTTFEGGDEENIHILKKKTNKKAKLEGPAMMSKEGKGAKVVDPSAQCLSLCGAAQEGSWEGAAG